MTYEKFWIIWNPEWPEPPKKKFSSLKEAEDVADRMAQKNVDSEFIVCEALIGKLRSKKLEKKAYTKKPKKKKEIDLSKQLLTYGEWKDLGYQVMYGQRAKNFRRVTEKGVIKNIALFSFNEVIKRS